MKPIHIVLAALLVALVAGAIYTASIQTPGLVTMTEAGPASMILEDRILRSYQVEARFRDEVHETLDEMLRLHQMGSVKVLPNGMLAVMAPFRQHQEIEALIAGVNQSQSEPTPTIQMDYWVVEGTPGQPYSNDLALNTLSPILTRIQETHGRLGFRILDRASITSQSGSTSILNGSIMTVEQRATANGSNLNAWVVIHYNGEFSQSLELNFSARPGEFLVLGNTTIMEKLYFYIVRWPGLQVMGAGQTARRPQQRIQGDVDVQ